MKESAINKTVITAVAVAVLSIPGLAAAGSDQLVGKSEKVSFSDLDVKKEADLRQLYRRLRHASERVCGVESFSSSGSLAEVREAKRCFREALDTAVAEIDDPSLTRIHTS